MVTIVLTRLTVLACFLMKQTNIFAGSHIDAITHQLAIEDDAKGGR